VLPGWEQTPPDADEEIHGPSSNRFWDWMSNDESDVSTRLIYPPNCPIERIERRIIVQPNAPAYEAEVTVYLRETCKLSFGLHPCFRLSSVVGGTTIETSAIRSVIVHLLLHFVMIDLIDLT
jgi:hypothetical protein